MSKFDYVVCVRPRDLDREPEVGSETDNCSKCNAMIWVAPGSQKVKAPRICMQCAEREVEKASLS